jgi:hypothetical protein
MMDPHRRCAGERRPAAARGNPGVRAADTAPLGIPGAPQRDRQRLNERLERSVGHTI